MAGDGLDRSWDDWSPQAGLPPGFERPSGACSFLVFLGLVALGCVVGAAIVLMALAAFS